MLTQAKAEALSGLRTLLAPDRCLLLLVFFNRNLRQRMGIL